MLAQPSLLLHHEKDSTAYKVNQGKKKHFSTVEQGKACVKYLRIQLNPRELMIEVCAASHSKHRALWLIT